MEHLSGEDTGWPTMHYPAEMKGNYKVAKLLDLVCRGFRYDSKACKQKGRERVSTSYSHRSYLGPLTTFNSRPNLKEEEFTRSHDYLVIISTGYLIPLRSL